MSISINPKNKKYHIKELSLRKRLELSCKSIDKIFDNDNDSDEEIEKAKVRNTINNYGDKMELADILDSLDEKDFYKKNPEKKQNEKLIFLKKFKFKKQQNERPNLRITTLKTYDSKNKINSLPSSRNCKTSRLSINLTKNGYEDKLKSIKDREISITKSNNYLNKVLKIPNNYPKYKENLIDLKKKKLNSKKKNPSRSKSKSSKILDNFVVCKKGIFSRNSIKKQIKNEDYKTDHNSINTSIENISEKIQNTKSNGLKRKYSQIFHAEIYL